MGKSPNNVKSRKQDVAFTKSETSGKKNVTQSGPS